jgi:hypothetical protein
MNDPDNTFKLNPKNDIEPIKFEVTALTKDE